MNESIARILAFARIQGLAAALDEVFPATTRNLMICAGALLNEQDEEELSAILVKFAETKAIEILTNPGEVEKIRNEEIEKIRMN